MEHAFSCLCGGFPSISHNKVLNLTASLLSEVCFDVGIEPDLQPLGCKLLCLEELILMLLPGTFGVQIGSVFL